MVQLKSRPENQDFQIVDITAGALTRERLLELGFLPGSFIRVLFSLPFSGPTVVQAGPITVALRNDEINCIWVHE